MDLCNITEIKALLARYGFHFSKAKGQNFLTQSWVPQNIVLESGVHVAVPRGELVEPVARVLAAQVERLPEARAAQANWKYLQSKE